MRAGESSEDLHVECRRRIAALEAQNAELKRQNQSLLKHLETESAELKRQNQSLLKRVEVLEARLRQNSQNSSKPPSSDPPSAPPRPTPPPTGRKPGGQPGHPGHPRRLLPPDQVNQLVVLKPRQCKGCGHRLRGQDRDPLRHQVIEIPPVQATVTEYQRHRLECGNCGQVTTAELPIGVGLSGFGPRLEATVAYLIGRLHLSKRLIQEMLSDMFGVVMSLGAIIKAQQRVSRALAGPYDQVRRRVQTEPMAHVDETGFREGRGRAWVWVAVTITAVLFKIHLRRSAEAARELLGRFQGILVTDRWKAYDGWSVVDRQLCWAHLIRDFRSFTEYSGQPAKIGRALLKQVDQMFFLWYRVRDGTLKFSTFQKYMGPIRRRIEAQLERGARCRHRKTAGMCREILKLAPALWTFVAVEGIEPTNNTAEREIRPMVLYRKISFGTQGTSGSRFIERIMTAVATLRLQGRHVLGYLVEVCEAARLDQPAPSLLSHRSQRAAASAS